MIPAPDAVVVGSGPNGLAAAVVLAQSGLGVHVIEGHERIGGGTRTAELTVPGVLHDVCSGIHPFAVASPYLSTLPLAEHGLTWRWPEVDLAHPLDDGSAGSMQRDLDATAAGLGVDGARWRGVFGPLAAHLDDLADDLLGPLLHLPAHPVLLARFGLRAALPATVLARRFRTEQAKALFGGAASHLMRPLGGPASSAVGAMLIAAGHAYGWPVAEGGSAAITDALASLLRSLGGTIETGRTITSLEQLPAARIRMFDTSPAAFAQLAGASMPSRRRSAYQRYRYGPAAFKVDLAVRGPVPWTAAACRRAGTVHLGGDLAEMVRTEAMVARGQMPDRPFVLVGQQHLADPTRSAGDVHPFYSYAHVPSRYAGDATEAVLSQIERFAPGFRDQVVAVHVSGSSRLAAENPTYVGGDILGGSNDLRQLVSRPRLGLDVYATGVPGAYLCSAATPPGAGVHGMCGYRAARAALDGLGVRSRVDA